MPKCDRAPSENGVLGQKSHETVISRQRLFILVTLTLNVALATGGDAGCGPEPFEPLPTPTPTQHCVPHCKRHFVLVVMCDSVLGVVQGVT